MQLTLWTYEGPPHIGAMRICAAMKSVHYVLHAPQGDTYADLLFTMIERRDTRPPVTYTTFQARDLGGDTAELFKNAARDAVERFKPDALIVGSSCTAELIQDDPGGLAQALGLDIPVVALELPAYQRKENWGASETFYRIVRTLAGQKPSTPHIRAEGARATCNILGPSTLGFRHRDDLTEVLKLLEQIGVDVNVVAPLGANPDDIARLGAMGAGVMLCATRWVAKQAAQPGSGLVFLPGQAADQVRFGHHAKRCTISVKHWHGGNAAFGQKPRHGDDRGFRRNGDKIGGHQITRGEYGHGLSLLLAGLS